jgi:ABC-2 type transport system ATP-binding protein
MGLLRAGSGVANIFGRDCWAEGTEIRREVGYVAGDVRLYPWLTTRRALAMLSRIHGCSLTRKGFELAERFRLEPDLPVRKMSRGNRQKVALVLALVHEPKLVILDEPTSGLDPLMQDTLMSCLREMAVSGRTVMFSSHTLSEVETLCDRIAIVRDGQIVEDSTVSRLKAQAPRQIVVTLHDGQDYRNLKWPESVVVKSVPNSSSQEIIADSTAEPGVNREQICMLELIGSSVSFMSWAAAQGFADIMIGPPSLEVLFRKYYETSTEAV